MANLNGHAAGNGGHRQGDPKSADRLFSYSAGILGGTMETSASFEARSAPSSYPTVQDVAGHLPRSGCFGVFGHNAPKRAAKVEASNSAVSWLRKRLKNAVRGG
jgi:hypothetical protein